MHEGGGASAGNRNGNINMYTHAAVAAVAVGRCVSQGLGEDGMTH